MALRADCTDLSILAGLNYCAYAAMSFITRLRESQISEEDVAKQLVMSYPNAIHWMLDRQTTWVEDPDSEEDDDSIEDVIQTTNPTLSSHPLIAGFNGRCGKMSDTCYCFWNIGALMVNFFHLSRNSAFDYLIDYSKTTAGQSGGCKIISTYQSSTYGRRVRKRTRSSSRYDSLTLELREKLTNHQIYYIHILVLQSYQYLMTQD